MILSPIIISIKVAIISTVITLIIGVLLSRLTTKYDFKGKDILEVILLLPMILPPSVVGYGLLILIGKRGIIGRFLYDTFGIRLIFTWVAACIAATIVSLPLMYQSCKSAFLKVDSDLEAAAMSLGANKMKAFFKVSLPLASPGILSGIVLAFARSLGEFGATLMVAGNIPGKTQNIPLAIYFAVEVGDTRTANILLGIVVLFSFIVVYGVNKWTKKS
ncbi:molybdate ABC transporter permease subunit [Proteiniborus sp. MB09-C3]|uniref:molybdate ABC transporter permease subunit n=1 Tax=Proteiniborus sp. MB09-C3 TaxID=3050072 RepID=UPI002553E635|nr:molybdate ABC transporter permease subunit [Proteiniborus sp. MB09-C3]WIV12794.1 molybdate ABC transporter permease subunit [Proteiniborus sp. MB09-C3]